MIDLHCHLDLYPDPKAIVERCRSENHFVLSVTTTPSAYRGTHSLAPDSEQIPTALGLHPQLAAERYRELPLFDELLPLVNWVGEVGLDGGREFRDTWEVQLRVFRHILRSCAANGGRLLSIHSRHAATAVIETLKQESNAGIAILHWFSGSPLELNNAVELDCWFSIGLPMLRSKKGRAIVASLPRNRVLTETDGPFTQNESGPLFPWDIRETLSELANLWREPEKATTARVQENLSQLITMSQ
ncbi:Qat anti-phage system TatD family nuclease QatD [Rosistilla oblonga]|uniref:Qat anti-phage system TatD family nuclease QatD n=1 Tax=Rosistilla oblonga TaxID=2527990 RepID=UPI003A987C40